MKVTPMPIYDQEIADAIATTTPVTMPWRRHHPLDSNLFTQRPQLGAAAAP